MNDKINAMYDKMFSVNNYELLLFHSDSKLANSNHKVTNPRVLNHDYLENNNGDLTVKKDMTIMGCSNYYSNRISKGSAYVKLYLNGTTIQSHTATSDGYTPYNEFTEVSLKVGDVISLYESHAHDGNHVVSMCLYVKM